MLLALLGVGVLLAAGGGYYFFIAQEPPPPPVVVKPKVVPPPVATQPSEARAEPPAPRPSTLPPLPPPPSFSNASQTAAQAAQPTGPTAAQAAAFRAWLDEARISGVVSGTSPRAIINNRLVRPGDVVDASAGITFDSVDVEKKEVIFRSRHGSVGGKSY